MIIFRFSYIAQQHIRPFYYFLLNSEKVNLEMAYEKRGHG